MGRTERLAGPIVSSGMTRTLTMISIPFLLAACSAEPERDAETANVAAPISAEGNGGDNATLPAPMAQDAPGTVLTLEGLGDLRLGQPVPADSSFVARGAQVSDECITASSPDMPGVYAMVIDGKVRRITVGQRSTVRLVEGIGVGTAEQAVRDAFPGFADEPHKYEDSPAKYLTAPGGTTTDPALRFEIGQDGKVSMMHVGLMPELEYVEGCA